MGAAISNKEIVIRNIIAAMGPLMEAVQLQALENVVRQNLHGLTVEEECTALSTWLYDGQPKRMSNHGIETVTKAVGRRAGLDKTLTVHVFRRTFATRLADKQCPREVIQLLMGHKKAETTDRYMGKSEERIIAAASKFFSAA